MLARTYNHMYIHTQQGSLWEGDEGLCKGPI